MIEKEKDFDEANETLEQLELLIGEENARKVFDLFKGENIYFPKRIGLAKLHNEICADLRSGMTYKQVALKYGYSNSYIRKIERRKMADKPGEKED
jgi:Mor family transcriptional regulator